MLCALQDCSPFFLESKNGDKFSFCGVDSILKGSVSCDDALSPPHCVGDESQRLSGAQLSNQATMAARRLVCQYYDGWIRTDDEDHSLDSRDICMKLQVENPGRRLVSEKQLYMQLKHLHRSLDLRGASKRLALDGKAVVKLLGENVGSVFEQASLDIVHLRDGCQFRWVSMGDLFGNVSTEGAMK